MRDDIKKRREKYENVVTPAMKLFHDKDLIIERKLGMKVADYKYMRVIQTKALKMLFKRSANPRIAALSLPSLHLQMQVAKYKALKEGRIEEVVPVEGWFPNFLTNIFNFFRRIAAQNYGRVPQLIS